MPIRPAFCLPTALAPLLLAACTSVASGSGGMGPMVADGQSFTLAPGASAMLADHSTLRYVSLVADSRCQPDVQCIRAGDAEIAMAWTPAGGATDTFSLKTPEGGRPTPQQSHAVGARRVTLVDLARGPAPQATLQVAATP